MMKEKDIPKEILDKLSLVDWRDRKFEEILLGVSNPIPQNHNHLIFILNGLVMRLKVEVSEKKIMNYFYYMLAHCETNEDWQASCDPLKHLLRSPGVPSMALRMPEWVTVAKLIVRHTCILKPEWDTKYRY